MKIKFITGFSCFGGSTIALIEHCKLLESYGHDVELYGDCDWHMHNYCKSKKTADFSVKSDDILVFHFMDLNMRPDCKKCLLYLHEQSLFDLKSRKISGYDGLIFVSDSQKAYHGSEGTVIPNPMSNLVDKSKNNPPGKNIAGVVGTIQQRKQQHISVLKALEDGCSKVLLFGDKEDSYFNDQIKGLLCEKVEYKGLYKPCNRMDMYNQFDILYNFSSDESASLVIGECKILEKKVIKSNEIKEYCIRTENEIYNLWSNALNLK